VSGAEAPPYEWDWFDDSPRGETYGVRRGDEVVCYTNRFKAGYEDALRIASALNAQAQSADDGDGEPEPNSPVLPDCPDI
jgi:hypothetical protein